MKSRVNRKSDCLKVLFSVFLFISIFRLSAQSFALQWAGSIGGPNYESVSSMILDEDNNVLFTGAFSGTLDFDMGPGTSFMTAVGAADLFVCKLDSTGALIWCRQMGGPNAGVSNPVMAISDDGELGIVGNFYGSLDFDPGASVASATAAGSFDAFVLKLSANGDFIWSQRIGGGQWDEGSAVAFDHDGSVIVGGHIASAIAVDGAPSDFTLGFSGSTDVFLIKYDPNGNFIWAKSMGGYGNDQVSDIEIDENNEVYSTGYYHNGLADFDPGSDTLYLPEETGLTNFFLIKMNSNGDLVWANGIPAAADVVSISQCRGKSMKINANNELVLTGIYLGTVDLDAGPGVAQFSTIYEDMFVMALDSEGNFLWAKPINGNDEVEGRSLDLGPGGDIYIAGYYRGSVDFDPGVSVATSNTNGNYDIFILHLDGNGNLINVLSLGGSNSDIANVVQLDSNGAIYTAGWIFSTVDFDPGSATFDLSSLGVSDMFIAKFNVCTYSTSSISVVACDEWEADGNIITESGLYTLNLVNAAGCDSIVSVNATINSSSLQQINLASCSSVAYNGEVYDESGLYPFYFFNTNGCDSIIEVNVTIHPSFSDTLNYTACNSFTLNNEVFTESGTYTQHLASQFGCDSLLVVHLTIESSTTETYFYSACNTATVNSETYTESGLYNQVLVNGAGCDSLLTLDITIHPSQQYSFSETSCDSYVFNGITYTETGSYTQTYTDQFGCDSIFILDLEILTTNAVANLNQATLTANVNNASYQWIKCNPFEIISGATIQSYTATSNGLYAVIINQNGCADTSSCVAVNSIGIENLSLTENIIHIYPNPSEGDFWIESNEQANYKLYSSNGLLVQKGIIRRGNNRLECGELPSGIYFMEFVIAERIERYKLMIR
jgi:hypothetical protein